MSGWVCLNCGNAKQFTEEWASWCSVDQDISENGDLEANHGDTQSSDGGDAECSACESKRCHWVSNIEDLRREFDSVATWTNFLRMFNEKNDTSLQIGIESKGIHVDLNKKLGG